MIYVPLIIKSKPIVKLSVIQGKYQKSFSCKMIKKYLLNGRERVIVIRGG